MASRPLTPREMHPSESATGDAGTTEPAPETTGWQHPRVATMLPAELLQGGEVVILLLKPSPWFILIKSLKMLAIFGTALALLVWIRNSGYLTLLSRKDLILLGFGAGTVQLFWQFLEWLSRVYVLTDRRLIRVKGVVRVQVFEAPLRKIQHTDTTFSFLERLLGLGTISFATAGTALAEASWRMIPDPLEVHRIVVEALGRYR